MPTLRIALLDNVESTPLYSLIPAFTARTGIPVEITETPGHAALNALLATDIDRDILERAASARYTDHEADSLPPLYRQKYFKRIDDHWHVSPALKRLVTFAPFNLMTPAYPFQHPFDVVFCRNVLIYFDRPTVADVLRKLSGSLGPGGHLYLGHSEAGTLRSPLMQSVAPAVYKRKEKA